jgi:hypothetical protein
LISTPTGPCLLDSSYSFPGFFSRRLLSLEKKFGRSFQISKRQPAESRKRERERVKLRSVSIAAGKEHSFSTAALGASRALLLAGSKSFYLIFFISFT